MAAPTRGTLRHTEWAGALFDGHECSIGYQVLDAIEAYMCHGEGDVQGRPAEIDDEMRDHIIGCYRLDPVTGRRLVDEAVLSRPKGRAKSEIAAWIATAEAFLPCRFDGWDADGQPVAKPVVSPLVKCLATEETQAGATFKTVAFIGGEWGQDNHPEVYGGASGTRRYQSASAIYLPHGGEIRACTSGSASKDGGLESHVVADEALALDTPLPTPTGWTTMGAVEAGDRLIGRDGRPTTVVKTTEVLRDRGCFRVTSRDGTSVVASEGHRWWATPNLGGVKPRVWTTGEMARDGRRFSVPLSVPIELPPAVLPVDPYALGAWLGDGNKGQGYLTAHEDDAPALMDQLQARGFWCDVLSKKDRTCRVRVRRDPQECPRGHRGPWWTYTVRRGGSETIQRDCTICRSARKAGERLPAPVRSLREQLKDAGVLRDKHVPAAYLRGSVAQRLDLLRGLMDTDGHVSERGSAVFVNTEERLAQAVVELCRSLGYRASIRCSHGPVVRGHLPVWRVHFRPTLDRNPFTLPRKVARVRDTCVGRWQSITIAAVEPEPVRCVGVDNDSESFLAGPGFTATMNTHLYVLSDLREMYATISRNLGKRWDAEPWLQQTTTAYKPGEQSVAEETMTLWRTGQLPSSVFVNHREARGRIDLDDAEHTKAQLRQVYGPAAERIDLDRKLRDMRDPRKCADDATAARYFLNRAIAGQDAWIAKDVHDRQTRSGDVVAPGTSISLGFDGSLNEDTTVLRGCRMSDGFLFRIGAWPKPQGAAGVGWEVPRAEVLATIREAFARYHVVRGYFDPHEWRSDIDTLAGELGEERVLPWETRRDVAMAAALDRLHADLTNGEVWHDPDPLAHEHYGNAYVRKKGPHRLVRKEHPQSSRKIDSVVGDALAYEARADAIAAGWDKPAVKATGISHTVYGFN